MIAGIAIEGRVAAVTSVRDAAAICSGTKIARGAGSVTPGMMPAFSNAATFGRSTRAARSAAFSSLQEPVRASTDAGAGAARVWGSIKAPPAWTLIAATASTSSSPERAPQRRPQKTTPKLGRRRWPRDGQVGWQPGERAWLGCADIFLASAARSIGADRFPRLSWDTAAWPPRAWLRVEAMSFSFFAVAEQGVFSRLACCSCAGDWHRDWGSGGRGEKEVLSNGEGENWIFPNPVLNHTGDRDSTGRFGISCTKS